jgi:hypothetical protein
MTASSTGTKAATEAEITRRSHITDEHDEYSYPALNVAVVCPKT